MKKMHLLENNVIMPFATLSNYTANPETLNVTECHQFRERGLLHISDGAYEFFLSLEQERVNNINLVKLTSHQSNMVDMSIKAVSSNKTLINHFGGLFHLDEDEDKGLVSELFMEIVERYMKMGAGQFLRDFRRDYHLKKSLAHRKAVLQRKEKANERRMKVHFKQMEQDRSPGKRISHARLLSLVNELTHKGLTLLYTNVYVVHTTFVVLLVGTKKS
ncbi:ATP-dependent DNA helicase PIF1 [Paramuricea clavata]|uniref:ATP-dependent DNA helicase PIF1 n=1 Tax=Paramuricea clavata TaxID=317549 RepID=A0A7D9HHR5_PARCT|nr:ATP-dependent DNA helicase PIF1 [Paramuricea clavata]